MNDGIYRAIGDNIRARRTELGISMPKVQRRMFGKLSLQQCRKYESGKARMAVDTLLDFAHALNCSPAALLVAYKDERPMAEIKQEGKLLQIFRSIQTDVGKQSVLKMARMAAGAYDPEDA